MKNDIMTKTNKTNSEEDQFNESLITIMNSQQDLQETITRHDERHDM